MFHSSTTLKGNVLVLGLGYVHNFSECLQSRDLYDNASYFNGLGVDSWKPYSLLWSAILLLVFTKLVWVVLGHWGKFGLFSICSCEGISHCREG